MSFTKEVPQLKFYIGGTWESGSGDRHKEVINPANGKMLGSLPLAEISDLDRALEAAKAGFEQWRNEVPAVRSAIVLAAAALVRERYEYLAWLTTLELGMSKTNAESLVMRAAEILEWDANEGRRLYGRSLPSPPKLQQITIREPIGPVAAFSAWNGSVFTASRKIGGALSAGCSIILKPAEETPLSAIALVRIFEEVGAPAGVLNLVFGEPAQVSTHLVCSDAIRLVTFTGSVPVGKHLAKLAAENMKPAIMELGGHAPVIICNDADLEKAASRLVESKFFGSGQVCISPTRIFVDDAVKNKFIKLVVDRVSALHVGDGLSHNTDMGPLLNERRVESVDRLINDAINRGGTLHHGGVKPPLGSRFYAPTVLSDVPPESSIMHEEPFGPVMMINGFRDLDKALAAANSLPYGLAAYAFTDSAALADKISRTLEAGVIGINHFGVSAAGIPFGGFKDSGYGREGGVEGVARFRGQRVSRV